MPRPGYCWRHGIIGTHGSWLPGSPRGWRSRGHRLHSSGDYKQPPPQGEHEGLYAYHKDRSAPGILIPQALRPTIGLAFRDALTQGGSPPLALAVAGQHCHFLAELPIDKRAMQSLVGDAKRRSSRSAKAALPGRVWAAGGRYIVVTDAAYQRRVFDYILRHKDEGAWVWSFRDGCDSR